MKLMAQEEEKGFDQGLRHQLEQMGVQVMECTRSTMEARVVSTLAPEVHPTCHHDYPTHPIRLPEVLDDGSPYLESTTTFLSLASYYRVEHAPTTLLHASP